MIFDRLQNNILIRTGNSTGPRLRIKDIRIGRDLSPYKKGDKLYVSREQGLGLSVFSIPPKHDKDKVWMLPKTTQLPPQIALVDDTVRVRHHYILVPKREMEFDEFTSALEIVGRVPPWVRVPPNEVEKISNDDPFVPPNAQPAILVDAVLGHLRYLKRLYQETTDDIHASLAEDINKMQLILEYWPESNVSTPLVSSDPETIAGFWPFYTKCKWRISKVVEDAILYYREKLTQKYDNVHDEDERAELAEDIFKLEMMLERARELVSGMK